jgi:putative flippase GtrA
MIWAMGHSAWFSKSIASLMGLLFNFAGRRLWVFPEKKY